MGWSIKKPFGDSVGKNSVLGKAANVVSGAATGGAYTTGGDGYTQGNSIGNAYMSSTGAGAFSGNKFANTKNAPTPKGTNPNDLVAQGQEAGRIQGEQLFGQTMDQTGQGIQRGIKGYEEKLNGADPITEALKQQKSQAMANANRATAGRGVNGNVAAAASEQIGRQKDIDIAASAYQQNSANLKDYTNLQSNIAANQGGMVEGAVASRISAVKPEVVKPKEGLLSSLF